MTKDKTTPCRFTTHVILCSDAESGILPSFIYYEFRIECGMTRQDMELYRKEYVILII